MTQLVIETINLNFAYTKSVKCIENLNLRVPKSSVYGFLGPNGSGKTTTIRVLLGLIKHQDGEVKIFKNSFTKSRLKSLSKVGALIETPSLYDHLTANENLKLIANYRQNISRDRIEEVLEIVKLSHTKNKKVKAFSLGMKQRLGLAIALLGKPELLILDEPTNGLDPKGIIEIRAIIKELNENHNTTVFISSHLLSEIEKICSHVGIIREGKMIFQDTVEALKSSQINHLQVELETSNSTISKKIVLKLNLNATYIDDNLLEVPIKDKETIPKLVHLLTQENISIYQVKIKDNLEELFLSLTES